MRKNRLIALMFFILFLLGLAITAYLWQLQSVKPDIKDTIPTTNTATQPSGSDVEQNTTKPDGSDASVGQEGTTTDGSATDTTVGTAESYKSVDLTIGRAKSSLYTYKLLTSESVPKNVEPSKTHTGFFEGSLASGPVLLSPDLNVVVFPKSAKFSVLEPFLVGSKVYFRVEDPKTNWKAMSTEVYTADWWAPLGGYAVLDSDGKEVIPFGKFDYIDQFVDGKARAYSVKEKNYYVIDVTGKALKTYPVAGKVAPYRLYPEGYVYTRSDVNGKHSHALLTWDDKVVIPYYIYKDNIYPKYLGDGTFLVTNGELVNGKKSGLVMYSVGKDERNMPKESYDVFSADDGKYITGMITNGLAGPLAKWEYVVTNYEGKVLIEQGRYDFSLGGWGSGYAVAKNRDGKLVLLDSKGKEVKLPDYMELTGRYSTDSALFTVKVTKDFEMWRYPAVPVRYDNPVGVVDKDFNWVIEPGVVDYLRNLPLNSMHSYCEYKQGEKSKQGSALLITAVKK